MQTQRAFRFWAAIRFSIGLAGVCGIGWLTDRTGWSSAARLSIDVVVIGVVVGLITIFPMSYRAYVDREQQRSN